MLRSEPLHDHSRTAKAPPRPRKPPVDKRKYSPVTGTLGLKKMNSRFVKKNKESLSKPQEKLEANF
jgi:hypothetical protein